ncbi:MAG: GtrA family protein [Sulfitobacter sp.]|nr:GtrA family protein [Sulfitobacter sp.]
MRTGGTMVRFALVGVGVAGLYVLAYLVLLHLGVAQALANALAFGLAVAVQYIGQAAFTFDRKLADSWQFLRFSVMIGLGFLTSALVTGWIGPHLGLSDGVSALMVTVILPLQNFILMSLWVFGRDPNQTEKLS